MVTEVDVFTGTGVLVPCRTGVKDSAPASAALRQQVAASGKRHTCCSVWIIGAEYDETEC